MNVDDVQHFFATDLRVLSADVNRGSEEAHDPIWEISYAEPIEDDDFRFVVGWLHCAGERIQVSVSIAAIVADTGIAPEPGTKFEDIFQAAEALDTIYQKARDTARILVALTDGAIDFPKVAPPAAISPFTDDSENDNDTEQNPEDHDD